MLTLQKQRKQTWPTNATLHGSAPAKRKTSATLHGNAFRRDWSPKMGPPKTAQTIYFQMFWNLFGARPEHPSCAHQKMDQLKWTPKSAHSECSKYVFSQPFLKILFFRIRFERTLLLRSAFKHATSQWFYRCF